MRDAKGRFAPSPTTELMHAALKHTCQRQHLLDVAIKRVIRAMDSGVSRNWSMRDRMVYWGWLRRDINVVPTRAIVEEFQRLWSAQR